MNKYLLLFITLTFIFLKTTKSQISISIGDPYDDPQYLVEDVLLGSGVIASNFSYLGDSIQIGIFDGSSSNLGLNSGVVIGTGDIRVLSPDFTGFEDIITTFPPVQDPDLLTVANSVPALIDQNFYVSGVFDVAVLEFDFVASSDTLSFDYVFGSSEYFAFENSSYNDVFGFFISGPGISGPYSSPPGFPDGAVNIAVVPESSPELPITISSLNADLNSEFFVSNQSFTSVNSADGFTIPLEAKALVQCGETYHIRLAIADGSDGSLSSYIFLRGNSFSSPEVSVINDIDDGQSTEIEIPCSSTVSLSAQLPSLEGYEFNWNTGEVTQEIDVSEGTYWVSLVNNQNCLFHSDTIYVKHSEPPYFSFQDNLSVCEGDSIFLKIDSISGVPPFSYNWSSGEVSDSIFVGSGNYELTVTDNTNCSSNESIFINSLKRPTAFLTGEGVKCYGTDDVLDLEFEFTGELPIIVNYGLFENQFIDTVNFFNYVSAVTDVGTYSIFRLEDNYCLGSFSGEGVFDEHSPFSSSIIGSKNICEGEEATLEISVLGLNPPYNILLNNNSFNIAYDDVTTNPFLLTVTDTALYKVVSVEDLNGCKSVTNNGSAYVSYKVLNEPNILPPDQIVFCQVDSAIEFFADLEGGSWSGKGISSEGVFEPVAAFEGENWIYYTYPENCNEGDSILLTVGCDYDLFFPSVFTPNGDGINDFFISQGFNILEYKVDIFDRWGSLLFTSNDMSNSWDGTFKGKLVPTGNYTYNAYIFAKNARYYNKIGSVKVIY